MFVKFKYVVGSVLVVGALVVLAVVVLGGFLVGSADRDKPMSPVVTGPAGKHSPQPTGTPQPAVSSATSDGKYAQAVRAANGTASPNSKKKDALGSGNWKINLYEETGDTHYDRAKVDRDRDDKWDEKWNWKGGRWERDGGAETWNGKAWASASKKAETPKAEPKTDLPPKKAEAGGDTGLATYAKRILNERASGKKAKDITGGSGPKINLYDDDQDGKWDRGKVDLDRDDTWDQKWTVKGGKLERKIEATGEVHVFENGAWIAKK